MNNRPIAWFDLETTGKETQKDRIIEIAIVRFDGDKRFEYTAVVNPGIPIPKEASDIHGFTDEMVKDMPLFSEIARVVHNILNGCDLYGYNSNKFDVPFIIAELERYGLILDVSNVNLVDPGTIFKRKEERTLTAAVKFYCDRDHTGAHGAMADVQASIDVYEAQKIRYPELAGMTIEQIALLCNYDKVRCDLAGNFIINEDGNYVINFGKKHKGELAKSCKPYLQWMLSQDFPSDTKRICDSVLAAS